MKTAHARSLEVMLLLRSVKLANARCDQPVDLDVVSDDLCWERCLSLAEEHYVMPLLASAVEHLQALAPAWVAATLAERFKANAQWSLRLAGEQSLIVEAAARRGVRVIGWKGPALAVAAYHHLGMRMFADLDLLVEPGALASATVVLEGLGFHVADSQPDLRVRTFIGADGLVVELHWAIMPWWSASDLRVEDLECEAIDLGGRSVPHLRPADLLVTLCAHGAKHRWHRLSWVADVEGVIRRRPDLDWWRAADLARRSGTFRALLVGLSLAEGLLHASLPDAARRIVAANPAAAGYGRTLADRFFDQTWPPRGVGRLGYMAWQWRLKERWRDRLRYAGGRTVGRLWCSALSVKENARSSDSDVAAELQKFT